MTETTRLILVTNYMWKHELIAFLEKRKLEVKKPLIIRTRKCYLSSHRKKDGTKTMQDKFAIARVLEKGEDIDKAHIITEKDYEILPVEAIYPTI